MEEENVETVKNTENVEPVENTENADNTFEVAIEKMLPKEINFEEKINEMLE